MKMDSEIKRDVEEELEWAPNVRHDDVAVAVKDGVVELAGYAPSYADRWGAELAAKRVAGVVGIANDIEVRLSGGHQRADPEIARDAAAVIRAHLPTHFDHIRVIVSGGWISLEGEVEWNYQRVGAEDSVRWLSGVKGVSNLIRVTPSVAPVEVKRKIEEAFRRSAEVDASNITVETSGEVVRLSGAVRSWVERKEAERAAWSAPGVTSVDNRISVAP